MQVPRLVASDVDGTLIDDEDQISARTRKVIAALVGEGVPFVLATGRPPRWIGMVAEQLGHAPVAVCANGAVLYDSATDRVISARTLDTDTLAWLGDLTRRVLPGSGLAAERIGSGAGDAHDTVNPSFVTAPGYEHAWLNPENVEVDEYEVLAQPAIKMLVRMPGASSAAMHAALAPHVGDRADITYSTDNGLIELAAPGITKASGLAAVAARHGVMPEDVVAFGDMPNDIPMLGWAGRGVAMANAHPDAIAVADEVTATNTADGVARVLERWWG